MGYGLRRIACSFPASSDARSWCWTRSSTCRRTTVVSRTAPDLQQINQRLAAAIQAYADAYNRGPVTKETTRKLLDEALAIDEAEAKLKSASVPRILAILPATKAARYIQIESKIRAAVRYELAAGIPLVR